MKMLLRLILGTAILVPAANCVSGQDPADVDKTVRGVIEALKTGDPLPRLGPEAVDAAPALIEALSEQSEQPRPRSYDALLKIGRPAIPHLIDALQHDNDVVRVMATELLINIDLNTRDSSGKVTFARPGPGIARAVPYFIRNLEDQHRDVRRAAAFALRMIGPPAKAATTALIGSLEDDDENVRREAVFALGEIGPPAKAATTALIRSLKDEHGTARCEASSALVRIRADVVITVPALVSVLKDTDQSVVEAAARALRDMGPGPDPKSAVSALGEVIRSRDAPASGAAADALATIARSVQKSMGHLSTSDLRELLNRFESNEEVLQRTLHARSFESYQLSCAALRAELHSRFWFQLDKRLAAAVGYFNDNKWPWAIVAYLVALPLCWTLILIVGPLWIVEVHQALDIHITPKVKAGNFELSLGLPLRILILLQPFVYRGRVLDAWVKKHLRTAKDNFRRISTVEERATHVPLPVRVDARIFTDFCAHTLRPAFRAKRCCLLIHGQGGVGKTSLACQVAQWARHAEKAKRITPHAMLPVLIEEELGDVGLIEVARGKLQALVGETNPIEPQFFDQLLRKKRVLVIVDGFSEMSEDTREKVRPETADFPVAALVVTSRIDEKQLGPATTLEPILLKGNRVSSFIEAYLTHQNKGDVFSDDEEYFDGCRRLTRMVGDREITVLLAKMYVDQLVTWKEEGPSEDLPDNIPELMRRYVRELHPKGTDLDTIHIVQQDAIEVAWQCVKDTFYPAAADREGILKELGGPDADSRLKYLEETLRILRREVGSRDQVTFVLDPLAEYLAGLRVVKGRKGDTRHWKSFLARADEKPLEKITGFLLAVRDCCLSTEVNIPDSVPHELARRGGLDLVLLERNRRVQRIRRLIRDLKLPDARDREHAAKALWEIGPAAEAALPALIEALRDENWPVGPVGVYVANALGMIGPAAKAAVPALVQALEEGNENLRHSAALALGRIALGAEVAVPALIKRLKDESIRVRATSSAALAYFGPEAQAAIPALTEASKDENDVVSSAAYMALELIGYKT